jgi:hypothetical protein
MTDRECLLQVIRSLKLKLLTNNDHEPYGHEYSKLTDSLRDIITLGRGSGYGGMYVEFEFDASGKCVRHSVEE